MTCLLILLTTLGLALQLSGLSEGTLHFAKPTSMPADRIADSYAIYSQLLKSGPIEWRDSPGRKQWLIEDTTTAAPLDIGCQSAVDAMGMNPHASVQATADRQAEWNEVLADYDQHCHDVIQLDRQGFRTELPVRLLNAEDKQNFMKEPNKPNAEFAGGAGLHRFTEVFSIRTTRWRLWSRVCGVAAYAETGRGWCWNIGRTHGRCCLGYIPSGSPSGAIFPC